MGRFIKNSAVTSLKDESTGSITLPSGSTADRSFPDIGDIRFNTDTTALEFYDGTQWDDVAVQGNVTITKDSFVGDGSTSVFTMSKHK